jgi:hypothetical protein
MRWPRDGKPCPATGPGLLARVEAVRLNQVPLPVPWAVRIRIGIRRVRGVIEDARDGITRAVERRAGR